MDLFILIIGCLVLLGILIWMLNWTSAGGIPEPKLFPIIGQLYTLFTRADDINDWLYEKTLELGETWSFWMIGQPRFTLVTNPIDVEHLLKSNFSNYVKGSEFHERFHELLGNGIFNVDGEAWEHQRKIAARLFKVRNFRDNMVHVFLEHTQKLVKLLEEHADRQEPIDLHAYFHRVTLDSIGQIGFGVDINSLTDPTNSFALAFDGAQAAVNMRFLSPFWKLRKYFHPQERQLSRSIAYLNKFTSDLVKHRLDDHIAAAGTSAKAADLLSIFLQSTDELPSSEFLRDLVINFIIAGRDTTAQAMSWMFYELIRHPQVLKQAQEQVDQVLGANNAPDYADSKQLPYLSAIFSEALRLHPSVPKDIKMTLRDDTMPTSGYKIKAGTWIAFSPYVMGRLTNLWGPDALEFKPERFIQNPNPSPFKYTAFQAGPRICLGRTMAELETLIISSVILQKFTFRMAPGHPPIKYLNSLTLQMSDGLWVIPERRQMQ